MSPTLATGGKCIVTSTPNSDDDTFAQIWHQAVKTVDEYGNTSDVGVNGFKTNFYWNPRFCCSNFKINYFVQALNTNCLHSASEKK